MNKQYIVIGITFLIISIGLSGCNDKNPILVEILEHDLEYEDYQTLGGKIIVAGSAKNVAGRTLETVTIIANLSDSNENFLITLSDTKYDIPDADTFNFNMIYQDTLRLVSMIIN